jgi:hypothetical protein
MVNNIPQMIASIALVGALSPVEKTGIDLHGWLRRVERSIDPSKSSYNTSREVSLNTGLYRSKQK